jgi:DNA-binding NarL/FixJ family response regulator
MTKNIKTHIYCFDDHRGFTEDVRKRFSDAAKYNVESFQTRVELINKLKDVKKHNVCKVAILGVHDTKDQIEMVEHLTIDIKNTDQRTGLILLGPPDKMDEIRKTVKFNIDAYIPKNTNSVLRIHNSVKNLISEHTISILRKRRNYSVYMLLGFLTLSILLILIAYLRLPLYF